MAILLLTDYGSSDMYVGQMKWALCDVAPSVPIIDLLHDVPPYNVTAAAHLVAAFARRMRAGDVLVAVVDPGVGSARAAIAVITDGRWLVAPDNGLASVATARSDRPEMYSIGWRPNALSSSFHGRDLFAPVAAMLASDDRVGPRLLSRRALAADFGADDLAEIVYIDHYGNAMTGLRACNVARKAQLAVAGAQVAHAEVFSAVAEGAVFWYENSLGLVEVAANRESVAAKLGLAVGQGVRVVA
jgi:S-adenosylmethionine hydrolase